MSSLVSVVIPFFNNEQFIVAAVESALEQTHLKVEVIVVNDGSTDQGRKRIDAFKDRIRIVDQPNQGACAARNSGLKLAKGEWIKFLDGDDQLNADCISSQFDRARSDEVIFGDFEFMDEHGVTSRHPTHRESSGINDSQLADLGLLLRSWVLISTTLYPKAALERVGGFRVGVRRGQEFDLHLRMYLAGVAFRYHEQVCFRYRQHLSPSRISNMQHGLRYFESVENLQHIAALAAKGPLSADWSRNGPLLGQMAWRVGREKLRNGRPGDARQLFCEARKLGGDGAVFGSKLYRLLTTLLGPTTAEQASGLLSRLPVGKAIR